MIDIRRIVRAAVAVGLATWMLPVADASAQDEVSIYGFGGLGNSPADFDVVREVDYASNPVFGGGLAYSLGSLVSIRGDVSWIGNSGNEIDPVDEPVDFTRVYFTAKLQLEYELDGGLSPYIFGGGGMISIERDATSYGYDFQEVTGALGLGVHYAFPNSSLGIFVEGDAWFYPRNTTEGSQFDKAGIAGISYTFQ